MAKGSNRKWASPSRYPRTARVNELLREVIATALERLEEDDPRLDMVTVTGVVCEADLRHAVVYFSALSDASTDDVMAGLDEIRVELQSAIAHEVRLKRTPQLRFRPDPAIIEGQKVEGILAVIRRGNPEREANDSGEID